MDPYENLSAPTREPKGIQLVHKETKDSIYKSK